MKQFNIYRTKGGRLSLKPNGEPVYVIRAKTQAMAKEVLAHLKQLEKNRQDNE